MINEGRRCWLRGVGVMLLLSPGCALGIAGRTQRVAVTSTPSGAEVLVNGASAGRTPVNVVVGRRAVDPFIRIQKDGFNAEERRLERGFSRWLAADVALSVLLAASGYFAAQQSSGTLSGPSFYWFAGGAAGLGASLVLVPTFRSGAAYAFADEVDVVLTPANSLVEAVEPADRQRLRMPSYGREYVGAGLVRGGGRAMAGTRARDTVRVRWCRATPCRQPWSPICAGRRRPARRPGVTAGPMGRSQAPGRVESGAPAPRR